MATIDYITTNIRLPKEDLKVLKQEAFAKEQSVGALLRSLVREHFTGRAGVHTKRARRSVWDLPKRAQKTGARNLASNVDRIVYGI
ncbi:MAG: hypothetical protein Q8R39_01685 [bacterium]|nr:hypothetical protein [bacterium]MDZ4285169.1 hypothetical protein [Patescibacteria group bacterium]